MKNNRFQEPATRSIAFPEQKENSVCIRRAEFLENCYCLKSSKSDIINEENDNKSEGILSIDKRIA